MGKSEVVNALAAHFILEHGLKIFMAKPEEEKGKSYKMVAAKIVGKIFHDPKVVFDEEAYDRAGEVLKGNLCILDLYQEIVWEDLEQDIIAAAAEGCKVIFIDPITNLTDHLDPGDANTELQRIAQRASIIAKDLDVAIFIFCHLKAPEKGLTHERGGKVLSTQFAGSRAMMRKCNYMLGLEGNKDPDLEPAMQSMRRLVLLEDREYGETGGINLHWNSATSIFTEV